MAFKFEWKAKGFRLPGRSEITNKQKRESNSWKMQGLKCSFKKKWQVLPRQTRLAAANIRRCLVIRATRASEADEDKHDSLERY